MKVFVLLIINLLFIYTYSLCQEGQEFENTHSRSFFVGLELGYNRGLGNVHVNDDVTYKNSGYLVRARIVADGYISPHLSLGGGFGMEGYHGPTYNLFPVFADLRYFVHPDRKSLFLKTNVGYAVGLSSNFHQGLYAGLGAGYRIYGKKIRTLFSIGFDFHRIKDDQLLVIYPDARPPEYVAASFWLKSVSFGIGFFF